MSDAENEAISKLVDRVSKLVNFAYVIGAAIFGLGVWVAGQQMTDQYQWDAISGQGQQIKEANEWRDEASNTLSRIDERTKSMSEEFSEIKGLLRAR